ncbi:hypothetical protein IEQ34_000462 [Dendrobium chrysotoxum]|uniref:Uncharacterized protein n=1 Tax=Dendrobium chrysotoxum TaxID=161865 RepID=A0AAV7HRB4_DENCH|nr:hypothetical protein IEQ34_000462 [Dendrobium chrysotoxum]
MHTWDPAKSWASAFFFMKNDWGLIEKWGKMRDMLAPLYVGEEDIMRILKFPDIKYLSYEVRYLNKYIEEEFLFRVKLSFHAGRLDARMFKPSFKVLEPPALASKDFKKSISFKTVIQDRVQEARDHIYEIEVKAFEQQYIDEGFIRGFMKGICFIEVEVKGLTPNQASYDSPPYSDGDEIKSELQKAFALEVDDEIVHIE